MPDEKLPNPPQPDPTLSDPPAPPTPTQEEADRLKEGEAINDPNAPPPEPPPEPPTRNVTPESGATGYTTR